jgi:hypothetical protein
MAVPAIAKRAANAIARNAFGVVLNGKSHSFADGPNRPNDPTVFH